MARSGAPRRAALPRPKVAGSNAAGSYDPMGAIAAIFAGVDPNVAEAARARSRTSARCDSPPLNGKGAADGKVSSRCGSASAAPRPSTNGSAGTPIRSVTTSATQTDIVWRAGDGDAPCAIEADLSRGCPSAEDVRPLSSVCVAAEQPLQQQLCELEQEQTRQQQMSCPRDCLTPARQFESGADNPFAGAMSDGPAEAFQVLAGREVQKPSMQRDADVQTVRETSDAVAQASPDISHAEVQSRAPDEDMVVGWSEAEVQVDFVSLSRAGGRDDSHDASAQTDISDITIIIGVHGKPKVGLHAEAGSQTHPDNGLGLLDSAPAHVLASRELDELRLSFAIKERELEDAWARLSVLESSMANVVQPEPPDIALAAADVLHAEAEIQTDPDPRVAKMHGLAVDSQLLLKNREKELEEVKSQLSEQNAKLSMLDACLQRSQQQVVHQEEALKQLEGLGAKLSQEQAASLRQRRALEDAKKTIERLSNASGASGGDSDFPTRDELQRMLEMATKEATDLKAEMREINRRASGSADRLPCPSPPQDRFCHPLQPQQNSERSRSQPPGGDRGQHESAWASARRERAGSLPPIANADQGAAKRGPGHTSRSAALPPVPGPAPRAQKARVTTLADLGRG